jgi:nucleoside phosphorylase
VDWESAAVGHVASMWSVPWAALKVVSDHGETDRLRRLAVVAKRPLEWAAETVRRACAAVVPAPQNDVEIVIDDGGPGP